MEFVLNHPPSGDVRVSFVLLDWSCRESLHLLDYLNDQTVPRDQYEIVWIEYYQERSPELCARIEAAGAHPPVDVYAVMGMPRTVYYHKHLMYNVGILLSHGRIICLCDSDAIVHPTFVESIIREFEADPNIVLHLDEVRNNNRRFYPFNNPDLKDVVGPGVVNWLNGRPLGLSDRHDPLHTLNYGACMCALRDDLIAIGGADMHTDYLGHICGPYEMTFRLINAGKREVWHQREWIYHVWHPGQAGVGNYSGPHDGKQMSTTALSARQTGRVEPLVAHPVFAKLRQEQAAETLLDDLIAPEWLREWDLGNVETNTPASTDLAPSQSRNTKPAQADTVPIHRPLSQLARMRLFPLVVGLLYKQLNVKREAARLRVPPSGPAAAAYEPLRKLGALGGFLKRMLAHNRHLLRTCWIHLCYVASLKQKEVALYGDGDAARIFASLSRFLPVRIRAVCPFEGLPARPHSGMETWTPQQLASYDGLVIVASFVNTAAHVRRLCQLGLDRDLLLVLE